MAIKYLAGERIIGTAAERAAMTTSSSAIPQTSWKELDRATLNSAGDILDTGTFAAKDNLMLLIIGYKSGNAQIEELRFNADDDDNYAARSSEDGGNEFTEVSRDFIELGIDSDDDEFAVLHIRNIANSEKLVIGHTVTNQSGNDAGTAPKRLEVVGKWTNTSNQITRVTITNPHNGDLNTDSELIVLGCDDDEADSGTNFWQELSSVELESSNGTLSSGTIAAKKYLWVQAYLYNAGEMDTGLRFNSDSGSNYSQRRSDDGGVENADEDLVKLSFDRGNKPCFVTLFIRNKSDKSKLIIAEHISQNSTGSNAPLRREMVAKWANASAR